MSRENELLDPRTPEDESTPTAQEHESEALNGSIQATAPPNTPRAIILWNEIRLTGRI